MDGNSVVFDSNSSLILSTAVVPKPFTLSLFGVRLAVPHACQMPAQVEVLPRTI